MESNKPRRPAGRKAPRSKPTRPVQTIKTKPRASRPKPKREEPPRLELIRGGAGKRKKFPFVAVFAAVLAILLILMNRAAPGGLAEWSVHFRAALGAGDGFPVAASGGLEGGLVLRDGNVYLLTDTALYGFNSDGKEIFARVHGYADPVWRVSRSRLLTFDRGGTDYRVDNNGKTLLIGESDKALLAGAVCDAGRFALASKASGGYLSKVSVYDPKGLEVFKRHFTKLYVSALALAPDGRTLAVCTVGAAEGAYVSYIHLMSTSKTRPLAEIPLKDAFARRVEFLSDDLLLVFTDKSVLTLNRSGKILGRYDSESAAPADFAEGDFGTAVLLKDPSAESVETAVFDPAGHFERAFRPEFAADALAAAGDRLWFAAEGEIVACSPDGKLRERRTVSRFLKGLAADEKGLYGFDAAQIYRFDQNPAREVFP